MHAGGPQLDLDVKMIFAKEQPAPMCPLLVHCGGPGSDDDCVQYMWQEALAGYDLWSISQRGMGDGKGPLLLCENQSFLPKKCGALGCDVSDFTDCPCASLDGTPQVGEIWVDIDPRNELLVRNLLTLRKKWGEKCFAAKRWLIESSSGKTYNFLEYVNTQLLARDIDLMRQAIGAEKMSVYGFSYGTYVGGVYATVFSENTGKVVLDGNMEPMPRKALQAKGDGKANDRFISLLLDMCKDAPQNCSLIDPIKNYHDIVESARSGWLTAPTKSGKRFQLTVGMLMAYLQYESTASSGAGYARALETLSQLSRFNSRATRQEAVKMILDGFCYVQGVSTWYNYDVCVGPGQTMQAERAPKGSRKFADTYFEQCAVWGTDLAGYYSVEDVMGLWKQLLTFGEAGIAAALGDMAGFFLWPSRATPTPPMGNPSLTPVIIGNLFDTSTSYAWTQDMRAAFSNGSLITWQGVGHTLTSPTESWDQEAVQECVDYVLAYLQNGTQPIDGVTCRQTKPIPIGKRRPDSSL